MKVFSAKWSLLPIHEKKFSPSKVSRYTVLCKLLTGIYYRKHVINYRHRALVHVVGVAHYFTCSIITRFLASDWTLQGSFVVFVSCYSLKCGSTFSLQGQRSNRVVPVFLQEIVKNRWDCHDKFRPPLFCSPSPYISKYLDPLVLIFQKNVDPHTSPQEFLSKCSDVDNNLLLSCTMNNGSIYIHNMAQSRFKLASSPGSLFFWCMRKLCTPPSSPWKEKRAWDKAKKIIQVNITDGWFTISWQVISVQALLVVPLLALNALHKAGTIIIAILLSLCAHCAARKNMKFACHSDKGTLPNYF